MSVDVSTRSLVPNVAVTFASLHTTHLQFLGQFFAIVRRIVRALRPTVLACRTLKGLLCSPPHNGSAERVEAERTVARNRRKSKACAILREIAQTPIHTVYLRAEEKNREFAIDQLVFVTPKHRFRLFGLLLRELHQNRRFNYSSDPTAESNTINCVVHLLIVRGEATVGRKGSVILEHHAVNRPLIDQVGVRECEHQSLYKKTRTDGDAFVSIFVRVPVRFPLEISENVQVAGDSASDIARGCGNDGETGSLHS